MGRTNLIILSFGLFACVALSLMMQHVVTVKDKKTTHPIVHELRDLFGDHLVGRPRLAIEEREQQRVAILTITPKDPQMAADLARSVGRFVVHFRDSDLQFEKMEVSATDRDGKEIGTYPIRVSRRAIDVVRRASGDTAERQPSGQKSTPPKSDRQAPKSGDQVPGQPVPPRTGR